MATVAVVTVQIPGIQGPPGQSSGNQLIAGAGTPSSGIGINGDTYIDVTNALLYGPKANGAWGAGISLRGPQGDPGQNGNSGPSLPTGGATGTVLRKASSADGDATWQAPAAIAFSGAAADAANAVVTISETSYTILPTDNNKILRFTNVGGCTVGLPANTAAGFAFTWVGRANAQITFQAASGGSLSNREGHTKSFGLHSAGGCFVDANSNGTSAAWVLSGDTGV